MMFAKQNDFVEHFSDAKDTQEYIDNASFIRETKL